MRAKLLFAAFLLAVSGLLAGCGRDTVNSPTTTPTSSVDQAEVASVLASEPAVIEDAQFENAEVTALGGATPGSFAAIRPLRFWRNITDVQRRFEFAFADSDSAGRPTTAIVTVHKLLGGEFNILAGTPDTEATPADSTLNVIHKPLADHWVRRILLKRRPSPDGARSMWRIVATSSVKVTSRDAQTRIESLRVQTAGLDTTITDPLQFVFLRRILKFEPETPITLTVTTLKNDDVVVLCRFGNRLRFRNNGDNTYTGVWHLPPPGAGPGPGPVGPPIGHFGVNALSRGTLFDDTAPYDSQAWLLPFLVVPDEIADALP